LDRLISLEPGIRVRYLLTGGRVNVFVNGEPSYLIRPRNPQLEQELWRRHSNGHATKEIK
jgi:hypothetical protein